MAYNNNLAERVRKALVGLHKVEERKMMGGLTFREMASFIHPLTRFW